MASVSHIRSLVLKWEGGLSNNPSDTASSNPAPWPYNGQTGWHTNKGITYTTFVNLAPKLGYAVTPLNFFTMPDAIWDMIFANGYWNPWNLNNMNSQAIADLIGDMAWGSGIYGSFSSIKKYLATKGYANINTTADAVSAINKLSMSNEQKIFLELIDWRTNFFKSLGQPQFLTGWLNRLNDIKSFGLETIKKKELSYI